MEYCDGLDGFAGYAFIHVIDRCLTNQTAECYIENTSEGPRTRGVSSLGH